MAAPAPVPGTAPRLVEITPQGTKWVRPPRAIYPPLSRRLNETGTVMLAVYFDRAGHAQRAEIVESSGFDRLDRAAMDAVRDSQVTPFDTGNADTVFRLRAPVSFALSP